MTDKDTHGRGAIPAQVLEWIDNKLAPSNQYGKYYTNPPIQDEDDLSNLKDDISANDIAQLIHARKIDVAVWENKEGNMVVYL